MAFGCENRPTQKRLGYHTTYFVPNIVGSEALFEKEKSKMAATDFDDGVRDSNTVRPS